MINPLVRKLELFAPLSGEDRAALDQAARERVRHYSPREDIISEGDKPRDVNVFLSGWACRYKQNKEGKRQIIAIFLPGDLCDHDVFILRAMDHHIAAITAVKVALLSQEMFERITLNHPRVTRALLWETLVNASVQREWTVNLGQRNAFERMAHIFCELFWRLNAIRLTVGNAYELPLTQADLGAVTGLSAVHVNRTLQELRAAKLIVFHGKVLNIIDMDGLRRAGMFTPGYLHLDNPSVAAGIA